ncbi:hypothetical protein [Fervidibacillus halotolerans]|uniref:Uncharacterized protein n=1 Tax=Fervidibacillus halotolerans TaxID=2980027 RepID=A0A9E8RZI2_9BACI|nr:hypothetical protein [Fervidibacillus halotolerans]WAA13368.1 hypothetical protein OE105_04435 [Fervidibacillus halotolerans]
MDAQELNKYIDAVFSIQTECRPLQDALKPEIAASQIEITAEQIARLLRF